MADHFVALKEIYLYRERRKVLLSGRIPLELSRAQGRFLDLCTKGGQSLERALGTMGEESLGSDTLPSHEELRAQLSAEDSYVALVPYGGPLEFDQVIVDVAGGPDGCHPSVPELIGGLPAGSRILLITTSSGDDEAIALASDDRDVETIGFVERRGHPDGTLYRFLQFARSLLRTLEPTRVYVVSLLDALYFVGALAHHDTAIGLGVSPESFTSTGHLVRTEMRVSRSEAYDAVRFWLRTKRPHEPIAQVVRDVRLASVAGLYALKDARLILTKTEEIHDLLLGKRHLLTADVAPMDAGVVLGFMTGLATGAGTDGSASTGPSVRVLSRDGRRSEISAADSVLLHCTGGLEDVLACERLASTLRPHFPDKDVVLAVPDRIESQVARRFEVFSSVVMVDVDCDQPLEYETRVQGLSLDQLEFAHRYTASATRARATARATKGVTSLVGAHELRMGMGTPDGDSVWTSSLRRHEPRPPARRPSVLFWIGHPMDLPEGRPTGWPGAAWAELADHIGGPARAEITLLDRSGLGIPASRTWELLDATDVDSWLRAIDRASCVVTDTAGAASLAGYRRTPAVLIVGDTTPLRAHPAGDDCAETTVVATSERSSHMQHVVSSVLSASSHAPVSSATTSRLRS